MRVLKVKSSGGGKCIFVCAHGRPLLAIYLYWSARDIVFGDFVRERRIVKKFYNASSETQLILLFLVERYAHV